MLTDRAETTIIVLEDEEDARSLIVSALRGDGYHVLEASHPQGAAEILAFDTSAVKLIIVDIILPELSGDQFARKMLDEYPFLKIIFASALSEEGLESQLDKVRYQCFLQKPFTIEALREAVRITLAI